MRGDGRIYREPDSRFWWMAYYVDGKYVRRSTKQIEEQRALRILRAHMAEVLRGEVIPNEHKVTLADLVGILRTDYQVNKRASLKTMDYPLQHLVDHFGEKAKAVAITTDRLDGYVVQRRVESASNATIRLELALLSRAFTLAVRARKLRRKPFFPQVLADPSRVRQGFFSRDEVELLCELLDADIADAVRFLFFAAWRVGEVRTLQWRDYDRSDQAIRLRPEHSKNRQGRVLPVVGELAQIIERRLKLRTLECPFVFHGPGCPKVAKPDARGKVVEAPCLGDFRKSWKAACKALGFEGRIVHDLRRSGVRHLIRAGVPPHTVMAFSGHRTPSMLKRYDIISLDDLRLAAEKGSAFRGEPGQVIPLDPKTRRERAE